jgi:hypothetical protein
MDGYIQVRITGTVPATRTIMIISYKKKQRGPPSKKKKRGKNLSPRNRKACHSVSTALLKSVAET